MKNIICKIVHYALTTIFTRSKYFPSILFMPSLLSALTVTDHVPHLYIIAAGLLIVCIGLYALTGVSSLWNDSFVLSINIWGVRVLSVQRYGIIDWWHQNWTAVCWTILEAVRPTNSLSSYSRGTYEVLLCNCLLCQVLT